MHGPALNMPSKRLFVFCDSTGQDGMIAPGMAAAIRFLIPLFDDVHHRCFRTCIKDGPMHDLTSSEILSTFYDGVAKTLAVNGGGSDTQPITNVLRLARAVKPYSRDDSKQQIVYYQSSVGLEANFIGNPQREDRKLQAQGMAVANKIRDAYAFLAQNFEIGDEIFLFGFSRGAYMARKLSGLIDQIGLLETQNLGNFFDIWRTLINGDTPDIPAGTRWTRIRCIGVWDTVGSIYNDINALKIKDTNVLASVDVALHAVSLQENRREFQPTLWTVPTDGLGSGQILKQVWFPGSHTGVGGSYHERRAIADLTWSPGVHGNIEGSQKRHELADIALFWMMGEILALKLFEVDIEFIKESKQENPDEWGSSQPQNAFHETEFATKQLIHLEDRLSTGDITSDIVLHSSWSSAPNILQDPRNMITPDALERKFPQLRYEELNSFEDECRSHWESTLPPRPIIYDDISKLFSGAWGSAPLRVGSSPKPLPSNALLGGAESNGTSVYIGRAAYNGGIHPGEYRTGENMLHIACDGKEVLVTGYELLVGNRTNVRWIRMTGCFSHDKLCGFHPVQGGKEGNGEFLYIIQGFHEGGVHCGKTKLGANGLIPYGGNEVVLDTYNVLVFDSDLYRFHNKVGLFRTQNHWENVKPGNTDSQLVHISPHAPTIPRILVGLNKVDISQHKAVRVRADIDKITSAQFTTNIGTWLDCRLFNSGASWLTLAAADPDFQHGDLKFEGEQTKTVPFNWRFDQPPVVYVGLRGFKVSGDRRINVSASDISRTEFNLNVDAWGNTDSLVCWVTWIAFSNDKTGVLCGTYGGSGSTNSGYSGSICFSSPFQRTPMIFVAFMALDIDSDTPIRVDICSPTKVTATGMDWRITTWAGSRVKKVRAAYLAVEPDA